MNPKSAKQCVRVSWDTSNKSKSAGATRRNIPEDGILQIFKKLDKKSTPLEISPSSRDVTLMMEAIRSSETSVFTRETRRNTPEEVILHSHRRENLKAFMKSCRLIQRLVEDHMCMHTGVAKAKDKQVTRTGY
jgi:hypothetical protein